ncbi:DNA topoisomerase IB [Pedobacter sp. SD-b]|uniref:DNA topoisomerase n=1 Tax=Pedobacter segetis TaxID=2793069 RepID=A0ABS1BGJ0_9SPHI|nr:DNA topoisomerase IB [Pedobacter segetis]MBK0381979.1 DNA topoisomerase IB [Pedobacter segetis]
MTRLEAKLQKIGSNTKVTAKAAGLRYIEDRTNGFYRKKAGKGFYYEDFEGKKITDTTLLERFKNLVIPPAYQNVWIAPYSNNHLQFTGYDVKGRKQYRYHADWNSIRNQAKFYRMRNFSKCLPTIRKQVDKDLKRKGLPFEKVLALVVRLIELTHIRIGNQSYSKLYGSFGLSTLKDRHVKFKGNEVKFAFKGKKGVYHDVELKSKKLASLVKKCRDIPGKELFQFYDHEGKHHSIDSGDVNHYLKEITGQDYTAKDFRTWAGSVHAVCAFKELGVCEKESDSKKNIVKVIDEVAKKLGNTRSVCKKYYIHPSVISSYQNGHIHKYTVRDSLKNALTKEERLLVKLLDKEVIAKVLG